MSTMRAALFIILLGVAVQNAAAQTQHDDYRQLVSSLESQEQELHRLRQRIEEQAWLAPPQLVGFTPGDPGDSSKQQFRRLPVVVEQPACDCKGCANGNSDHFLLRYYCDYDQGFVIRPFDADRYPFDLRFNGRIQFRHHGFARDVDTWRDNAGVTREVRNRNGFDIERARLLLRGSVLDPRVSFFLQLDGDTEGRHVVDFFDYWWGWRVNDSLQIQVGKRKVSGSRQWLLGAFDTMFVDRAVATDFFRPDRTVGIWFVGDLTDRMHYELMVGNGYRTTNLPLSQQDDGFGYAASHWIDLGEGEFGNTFSDYECHSSSVVRLGHSFTTASQGDTQGGVPLDESDFARLTDGTVLTDANALAPGTRVEEFDIYTYTVDAAWKYRGWSVNGEYFLRWLEEISGTGVLPTTEIFDRGFYLQTSVYLVPETLYVAGRVSQVKGQFGDHYEYAGAVNWYIGGNRNLKMTFDVTSLDGSPLNNTTVDILVGDDGLLFRSQFQARF